MLAGPLHLLPTDRHFFNRTRFVKKGAAAARGATPRRFPNGGDLQLGTQVASAFDTGPSTGHRLTRI
jgi:hypothetical protein